MQNKTLFDSENTHQKYIILFDGTCAMCNGFVQVIIKNDKQNVFQFATLDSRFSRNICKQNNITADSVVLVKGEVVALKSEAIFLIISQLRKFRYLAIFQIIPNIVADFVYDFIAKHRKKFFYKTDICWIMTEELKGKFLE